MCDCGGATINLNWQKAEDCQRQCGVACAVIHMCVYLGVLQLASAHGKPSAAEAAQTLHKQPEHVIFFGSFYPSV